MTDPALPPTFFQQDGYLRIRDRLRTYLPQYSIVGTLLEVGRGKRCVEDFAALILDAPGPADDAAKGAFPERGQSGSLSGATPVPAEGRSGSLRSLAGDSVPGHALFFSGAEYPED